MTTFKSHIKLGEKYRDERFGVEGYAEALFFNPDGCVQAWLSYAVNKGTHTEIEHHTILHQRLVPVSGTSSRVSEIEYVSDLLPKEAYEDIQTGMRGHLSVVAFYEDQATRGELRTLGTDKNGLMAVRYHSIDDFLLKHVETQKVAEPKTEKQSPASYEVFRD